MLFLFVFVIDVFKSNDIKYKSKNKIFVDVVCYKKRTYDSKI